MRPSSKSPPFSPSWILRPLHQNTPSCKGVLPPPAYTNQPIHGHDANETELKTLGNVRRQQEKHEPLPLDLLISWAGVGKETQLPISQALQGDMSRERWLIWAPRFGLGNSLRGYTSAFIFALLSGRRFLRWHGGSHRKVLERLCDAFYCGLDELHYKGDMRKHTKLMEGRELVIHGLNYYSPVMAVTSDPQINQCVHDAFNCRSLWCIQSQVLSLLLGKGPKPGVQEVVDRDLRVVPPLVFRGGGMGMEEGEEKGGKVEPQMVAKGEGLRLQFDLSIHIRGHSVNVEGDHCGDKDTRCQERAQQAEISRAHNLMKPNRWRCIARLAQFLRVKKAAAGGFPNATAAAAAWSASTTAAAPAPASSSPVSPGLSPSPTHSPSSPSSPAAPPSAASPSPSALPSAPPSHSEPAPPSAAAPSSPHPNDTSSISSLIAASSTKRRLLEYSRQRGAKLELFTFESLNRSPVVIPDELGQAKKLRMLKIGKWENGFWDDSNLESMPETLGNLTNLLDLTIASDKLSHLPDVFGPLGGSLSSVRIRSMELSSLPASMTLLTSLTSLELECMVLSELPEAIHSLSSLTSLTLSCCGTLTHLPETLGSLPQLIHLKLHSCRFLSELPTSTTALSFLETLTISRCASFAALPKFFGRLKSLRTLHLDVFESFESLPESMGDLQKLEKVFLSAPGIKSLPNSFGRLSFLRELEMEGCEKLWYIPSSFGKLSNLRVLRIIQCPMLSSLPGTCGQLLGLEEFVVGECGHFHVPPALSSIVTFESPMFSVLQI
ncbi:unnamed protein product [Closterium sp. Yama58-4]|nr:unnamed protein product [Closterium sp. Yama58-4]